MADEVLSLEEQHANLLEEYKLLQHEHETLKSEMGRDLAELRATSIRLTSVNRRLLEDVEGKKNEVAAGASLARDLQGQIEVLGGQLAEAKAQSIAAVDRYNQVVAKIAELREAVKPLIALVSRA
jgi:chromosome segregation ATPase